MKKVVCFMLAIIMMLSMTVTAFAAGNNNSENAPHIDPIFDLVDEISMVPQNGTLTTTTESIVVTGTISDADKIQALINEGIVECGLNGELPTKVVVTQIIDNTALNEKTVVPQATAPTTPISITKSNFFDGRYFEEYVFDTSGRIVSDDTLAYPVIYNDEIIAVLEVYYDNTTDAYYYTFGKAYAENLNELRYESDVNTNANLIIGRVADKLFITDGKNLRPLAPEPYLINKGLLGVFIMTHIQTGQEQPGVESPAGQGCFNATVLEITDDSILVECYDSIVGGISVGKKIQVSTNNISSERVPNLKLGDNIRILYIGNVSENEKELLILENTISIFLLDENGEVIIEDVN